MMIHHYVYALKTFFTWLEITEQIDCNPISGLGSDDRSKMRVHR